MKKIVILLIASFILCSQAVLASGSKDSTIAVQLSTDKEEIEEKTIAFNGLFDMVRTNQMHLFYSLFACTTNKVRRQISLHVDKEGYSLMHLGIEKGDKALILEAISEGAKIDGATKLGTPIQFAEKLRQNAIAKLLQKEKEKQDRQKARTEIYKKAVKDAEMQALTDAIEARKAAQKKQEAQRLTAKQRKKQKAQQFAEHVALAQAQREAKEKEEAFKQQRLQAEQLAAQQAVAEQLRVQEEEQRKKAESEVLAQQQALQKQQANKDLNSPPLMQLAGTVSRSIQTSGSAFVKPKPRQPQHTSPVHASSHAGASYSAAASVHTAALAHQNATAAPAQANFVAPAAAPAHLIPAASENIAAASAEQNGQEASELSLRAQIELERRLQNLNTHKDRYSLFS